MYLGHPLATIPTTTIIFFLLLLISWTDWLRRRLLLAQKWTNFHFPLVLPGGSRTPTRVSEDDISKAITRPFRLFDHYCRWYESKIFMASMNRNHYRSGTRQIIRKIVNWPMSPMIFPCRKQLPLLLPQLQKSDGAFVLARQNILNYPIRPGPTTTTIATAVGCTTIPKRHLNWPKERSVPCEILRWMRQWSSMTLYGTGVIDGSIPCYPGSKLVQRSGHLEMVTIIKSSDKRWHKFKPY